MEKMQKVKTAVVGCGMISTIYIKNLVNMFSIIDLVALCDLNAEAAKEKAKQYGVPNVMTLEEVLASEEIELVVNLTAPFAHYDVIKQALNAGKHVFTEKMLCTDLEQGKELVSLAEEKGLYLGVAPDVILCAGMQTMRKLMDAGMIGKVTSVLISLNRNQPLNSEKYSFIRKEGGAFPYDVGVYSIAGMLSLLGPVKRLTGIGKPSPAHKSRCICNGTYGEEWELCGNNLVAASVEFESGVVGSIHFNGESINDNQKIFMVYGTEGILCLSDPATFGSTVKLIRVGEGECEIPLTHGYKGCPLYGEPTPYDWGGNRGVGAAELAWSLRLGKRPNRVGKELGLHTMEVLCGIDISSETGKVYEMTTTFDLPRPLPSGYLEQEQNGMFRTDSEMSLVL